MILLTNFFYLVIYLTFPFLGVVPLVSVLLTSASGWLFWEYLAGLMLYSMDACSLWSAYTSVCTAWSVQIWSFFSRNTRKYGPEKITFGHFSRSAVNNKCFVENFLLKFTGCKWAPLRLAWWRDWPFLLAWWHDFNFKMAWRRDFENHLARENGIFEARFCDPIIQFRDTWC